MPGNTIRSRALSAAAAIAVSVGAGAALGAEDPHEKADRSPITLSGTVASSTTERFILDYGEGLIVVEMDDWDWYDEANQLRPGDRVTVYGRLDADAYETRTIEAESVYVFDRRTFYLASDADEEDYLGYGYDWGAPAEGTWMTVVGTIEEIQGRELVLDTATSKIRVDTSELGYNPLDEVGLQRLARGDRVSVSGRLDLGFFERKEIVADTIVSLARDKTKKSSAGSDADE